MEDLLKSQGRSFRDQRRAFQTGEFHDVGHVRLEVFDDSGKACERRSLALRRIGMRFVRRPSTSAFCARSSATSRRSARRAVTAGGVRDNDRDVAANRKPMLWEHEDNAAMRIGRWKLVSGIRATGSSTTWTRIGLS
jgi:hypothetical protein